MPSAMTIIVYCMITMSPWKKLYFYFPWDLSKLIVNTLSRITIGPRTEIRVSCIQCSVFLINYSYTKRFLVKDLLEIGHCGRQHVSRQLRGSQNPFISTGLVETVRLLCRQYILLPPGISIEWFIATSVREIRKLSFSLDILYFSEGSDEPQ